MAFYTSDIFNDSANGAGNAFVLDQAQINAIGALLRVLNALENIRSSNAYAERSIDPAELAPVDELGELAIAETTDAIEVLTKGPISLHPEAVALLQEARQELAGGDGDDGDSGRAGVGVGPSPRDQDQQETIPDRQPQEPEVGGRPWLRREQGPHEEPEIVAGDVDQVAPGDVVPPPQPGPAHPAPIEHVGERQLAQDRAQHERDPGDTREKADAVGVDRASGVVVAAPTEHGPAGRLDHGISETGPSSSATANIGSSHRYRAHLF